MRTVQEYMNWVLPSILKNSEWNVYIKAILNEVVVLQKCNMGSYNDAGFNTVEEDISLDDAGSWVVCSEFNPYKAVYNVTTEGWVFVNKEVHYTGGSTVNTFLVTNYAVVLERKYKVRFILYDIFSIFGGTLYIGLGEMDQYAITIGLGTSDPLEVEVELEAKDYWLYLGMKTGDNGVDFKIRDIIVEGVEEARDNEQLWLVLKRIVAVDKASRFVLERMRGSYTFPSIANMPEELLRQLIKDFNIFIGYSGSELASIMFFYFLGYTVDFIHLYAHKGDYESKAYSYIAQKEDDLFISGVEIYAQVKTSVFLTSIIELESGHQIIEGDAVANQTNPFIGGFVNVITVEGDFIYMEEQVTVATGDVLDIFRKYSYAVNPDPDDYFKTSHIDVFFKQKYLSGVDISFTSLEEFFIRYLPVNVVIRFFGYSDAIPDDSFKLEESLFDMKSVYDEPFLITGDLQYPVDDHAFVVQNADPETHKDIYGNPVDGYSYLIIGFDPDGVTPKYVVVPYP